MAGSVRCRILAVDVGWIKASGDPALSYDLQTDYRFTPAAERAVLAAGNWTCGSETGLIAPPNLLLGLLAEAESRAAEMLATKGVNSAEVLARWPNLKLTAAPEATRGEFSPGVQVALAAAASLMTDFPRPLELATEHLLLGLVAAEDELADWLAERGFAVGALKDQICRLYGYATNGETDEQETIADVSISVPESETASPDTDRFTSPPITVPAETIHASAKACDQQTALLRLIDAAANRAREGLRVVEDFVRFVWNDRHLMFELKRLRHELAAALSVLPGDQLLAARDTQGDVGTAISTESERERPDVASVVTANFKRLQEALRSIEEFGKVLDATLAEQVEQLR